MTKLTCHVSNCINNENSMCCRPDIKVEGASAHNMDETCCHSFGYPSDCVTSGMVSNSPSAQIQVRCDACDCAYNQNTVCNAERICIDGYGAGDCHQTCCSTFRCKSQS